VKDGASSTISSVAVGDTVAVRGTISGTNITATMIADGVVPGGANPGGPMRGGHWMSSSTQPMTPPFQGNGEPVVGGTVTAISGSSLTVTNKSNVTYTVDGSSATVVKGNVSSSLADVSVNDNVLIQGAVSGTNVTATTILDQGAAASTGGSVSDSGANGSTSAGVHVNVMTRMFGGIGSFFQHIFGFF
jgi:hypothetical protein